MMFHLRIIGMICIIMPLISFHKATEIFSAVVHLKQLLHTEHDIVDKLNLYIDSEEKRLKNINEMYRQFKEIDKVVNNDPDQFLMNPVNAFLLLKRLYSDWKIVQYLTKDAIKSELFSETNTTFPTEDDVKGAADALLRLQKVYRLDTTTLSTGIIPSTAVKNPDHTGIDKNHISQQLTANDCFDIGFQAFQNENFAQTLIWMEEALRLADEGKFHFKENFPERLRVKILEYFSYSLYKEGYIHEALEKTHDLLQLDPMHPLALGNVPIYQSKIVGLPRKERNKRFNKDDGSIVLYPGFHNELTYVAYEALCRGENVMSEKNRSRLTCFYMDTKQLKDKYFLLWKIQVEEANKHPHIVQFHEIITDDEIEIVKALSETRLQRATVNERSLKKSIPSKIRISQSFFIPDKEHEVIARLSRRIQGITGLTMKTAEHLQVGNYGLGGHYEPHNDHGPDNDPEVFKNLGTGNRIATWMFYMSDVTAGGATVFPAVGAAVWPRKGSAAFWYNLRSSGNGDPLTRHAGCPVLVGTKWVANKWIHEKDQVFRKLCHTKHNEFYVVENGHH